MPAVSLLDFLTAIYPEPLGPGRLALWTRMRDSGLWSAIWSLNLDAAARQGYRFRNHRDIYIVPPLHDLDTAMTLARVQRPRATDTMTRPAEESATLLPALYADLDVADRKVVGPAAARRPVERLPPDLRAAQSLLRAVEPDPSILVDAGGRLQAYWLLREPLVLDDRDGSRRRAQRLLRRLQQTLRGAARERGWWIEDASSLGHLMRLPGTASYDGRRGKRGGGEAVEIIQFPRVPGLDAFRYAPEDFDGLVHVPELPALDDTRLGALALGRRPRPRGDLRQVWAGCDFLKICYQERTGLSEAELAAAVNIVGNCDFDGVGHRSLVQELNRDRPGFQASTTDALLDAELKREPRSCEDISRLGPRALCCHACPHRQRGESPITLGLPAPRPAAEAAAHGGATQRMEPRQRGLPARLADGLEELLEALGGRATSRQMVDALAADRRRFATLRAALAEAPAATGLGAALDPSGLTSLLGWLQKRMPGGRVLVKGKRTCTGVRWSLHQRTREVA